jgi:cysteine synthase
MPSPSPSRPAARSPASPASSAAKVRPPTLSQLTRVARSHLAAGRGRACLPGSAPASAPASPPDLYDQIVRVGDAEAFAYCRTLAATTGIAVGGSSGASLAACARLLADDGELERVACICPDGGRSYRSTIYSNTWLARNGIHLARDDHAPVEGITAAGATVAA